MDSQLGDGVAATSPIAAVRSTASTTISKLAQMQMRFQQKQQLEREHRRVEMTSSKLAMEETTTATRTTAQSTSAMRSSTKALNSSMAPGKVRQMFNERRRGTGIDKSYPLKPLSTSNNNNAFSNRPTSSSSGSSSGRGNGLVTKKTISSTINSTNRNGSMVTNKTSTTSVTATKFIRKQQTPLSPQQQQHKVATSAINSTMLGGARKAPLNERLNASSLTANEIAEKITQLKNGHNSNIDDDDDDNDNHYLDHHNNNNDDNYQENNDYDIVNENNEYSNIINDDIDDDDDSDAIDVSHNQPHNGKSYDSKAFIALDEETIPDDMSISNNSVRKKLPNLDKLSLDERNNNAGGDTKSSTSIKLKPVITRKTLTSSPVNNLKKTTTKENNAASMKRTAPNMVQKPIKERSVTKTPTKTLGSKVEINKPAEPVKLNLGPPPPGMGACSVCGRHFNIDRIEKHEVICQKAAAKKRKIFDSTKHRVKGTEAEIYLRRTLKSKPDTVAKAVAPKAPTAVAKSKPVNAIIGSADASAKKSNWRKKHEEFIAAIRAAKEVQKHLAKGGKLSDLPPPPPSENPDYIQCPHCSRRFNEAAANRHIPKCANMMHNKPKKSTPKKRF